jgi:hypothetical protein
MPEALQIPEAAMDRIAARTFDVIKSSDAPYRGLLEEALRDFGSVDATGFVAANGQVVVKSYVATSDGLVHVATFDGATVGLHIELVYRDALDDELRGLI